LAWKELESQILAVGAKHTIVFLDACHGGAALDSKGAAVNPPAAGRLAEQVSAIGRTYIVFSSASSTEVSSEDEEFHQGIFTHFVVEGMRGAAAPDRSDGTVTVQALSADGGLVRAAGAYSGRPATVVSMRNESDGALLSTRTCQFSGVEGSKSVAFVNRGNDFLQMDSPSLLVLRDSLTCQARRSGAYAEPVLAMFPSRSEPASVAGVEKRHFFRVQLSQSFPGALRSLDSPIDEISLAPDGENVVLLSAGRVLRIPLTIEGAIKVGLKKVNREFTPDECRRFFQSRKCPSLLQPQ
jgi:hypothetical protein